MQEPYLQRGFIRYCWERLLTLIVLNLLFLLSCVPLFTIPGAISALARACQGCLLEEPHIFRIYFHSLRVNCLPAIPLGIPILGGLAGACYGCLFYYQTSHGEGIAVLLSVFCCVCVYFLFCIGAFAFQILARVEMRVPAIMKNAFYSTFQWPRVVFGWLLLSFGIAAAVALLLPYSMPWLLLLGGSLPTMAAARGVLPIIDSKMIKE